MTVAERLPEQNLLRWVHALVGLAPEQTAEARSELAGLRIPHVSEELAENPSIDAAAGAALLWDSMKVLEARGVPRSKLVSKLRNDPDVWPTWAEVHAAASIAARMSETAEVVLEPRRSGGRHADFHVSFDGGEPMAIEFKALGLSDEEARACEIGAAFLRRARPKRGMHNLHTPLGTHELTLNRERRRHAAREAERRARNLPPQLRGMAAASVVAHGGEPAYLARLRDRFAEAIQQLPRDRPSWIALHWSGGAPTEFVARAVSTLDLPDHVAGFILFGSVVIVPAPVLHHFLHWRLARFDEVPGTIEMRSTVNEELAASVLDFVEEHSMPRATIVWVPYRGQQVEILTRDGSRRILPFSILLGPDPPGTELQCEAHE